MTPMPRRARPAGSSPASPAALLALLAWAGAACRVRDEPLDEPPATGSAAAAAAPAQARILYPGAPGSFVGLIEGAQHGVVAIRAAAPVKSGPAAMFPDSSETGADVALGTGFLIEAKGIHVLTTYPIATASAELRVVLPGGTEVPAKLLGPDPELGIALLSIDVPRLHGLRLGNSDDLRIGEWVVVLGNAFGDEVTASAGIVSATGREAAGASRSGRATGFRSYLQTDARIHRGNAGGPVIDAAGQVVGLAVATGDRSGELSFAIPINRVREVIEPLRDHGAVTRSWLGVLVKPVTAEEAQRLGLPKPAGALVTEVKPGSPAAHSVLRPDDVILRWGDRDVDHRTLPWIVAATPVGKSVPLVIWRSRAEHAARVVTEKMPE